MLSTAKNISLGRNFEYVSLHVLQLTFPVLTPKNILCIHVKPRPRPLVNLQAKTYCARWHMLAIFFFLSFNNGIAWIVFAPVAANTGNQMSK